MQHAGIKIKRPLCDLQTFKYFLTRKLRGISLIYPQSYILLAPYFNLLHTCNCCFADFPPLSSFSLLTESITPSIRGWMSTYMNTSVSQFNPSTSPHGSRRCPCLLHLVLLSLLHEFARLRGRKKSAEKIFFCHSIFLPSEFFLLWKYIRSRVRTYGERTKKKLAALSILFFRGNLLLARQPRWSSSIFRSSLSFLLVDWCVRVGTSIVDLADSRER